MGIAEMDIGHWAHLSPMIDWRSVQAVCDLGQQELFTGSRTAMRRNLIAFLKAAGARPSVNVDALMSERWIPALWTALGRTTTSIDVVGSGDAFLNLDLNFDTVPDAHRERYDFVTNCGTTERVFNQYNSFHVIHDLTKPGGYMYHSLPSAGYTSHGFFTYNTKFFLLLALVNNYKFLDAFMTVDPNPKPLDAQSRSLMRQEKDFLADSVHGHADHLTRDFLATDAGIRVCLQKPLSGGPFKPPLDIRAENVDVYGVTTR